MYRNVSPNAVSAPNPDDFQIAKYMKMLETALENDTENFIEKYRGIYGILVKNGPDGKEGLWIVNAKEGKGKVTYNGTEKPDVTFTINDGDVADLISGKLNTQKAFFQGKLKITGNTGLAMKLASLQKKMAARVDEIRSKL